MAINASAYDTVIVVIDSTVSDGGKVKNTALIAQTGASQIDSVSFTPSALNRAQNLDQLMMTTTGSTASLEPGKQYSVWVQLKDGRTLKAPVTVDLPRPQIELLSKGVHPGPAASLPPVQWGAPDDLPVEGKLVFFLQSKVPAVFPRDEKIQVAGEDTNFETTLSLADGSLMLEDAHTAVANIEPLARFGSSAFGPVHLRAIAADGAVGDWVPLGTFVRLPAFRTLRCPSAAAKPCLLDGSDLFLAVAVAATPSFDDAVDVPPQFTGEQLAVPHPVNGALYLKLRDDPATVQTLSLPVTPLLVPTPAPPAAKPAAPVPVRTPASAQGSPAASAQTPPPAPHSN